ERDGAHAAPGARGRSAARLRGRRVRPRVTGRRGPRSNARARLVPARAPQQLANTLEAPVGLLGEQALTFTLPARPLDGTKIVRDLLANHVAISSRHRAPPSLVRHVSAYRPRPIQSLCPTYWGQRQSLQVSSGEA